jgi:nucleotide-binding universal stress UspA family protein
MEARLMEPVRKILVAVDFSEPSEAAARYGVAFAEKLGAEVTLFNAYFLPATTAFPDGSAYIPGAEVVAELASAAERNLRALRDRVASPSIPVHIASAEGPAKALIPHVAEEGGFDLIIVGTHGRTGLSHVVLGSVAESVVRHASMPVLTVRAPRHHATKAA